MNIWSSISSKKFFQALLDLLRTRDIPEVQMKLLGLIQKWGLNFEDKRSALPNFFGIYNKLRNSNIQFPNNFESNYQIYISNSKSNNFRNNNNYDNREDDDQNENSDNEDGETFYYMDSLKNKLKVPNFEHKYRRLVNFLVKMHENIQMANLLMDSRERAGLKDIINTLREGNNTLIDTISGGRLKDEKLMEITLGTTEDINQTLNREEEMKNGYKPNKFKSYFVLNDVIPIKGKNNNRTRAKSTKHKKSMQRRDERYKNYDMELNDYDKNKYKEKIGKPKNADDIFDLFSATNLSNEPGYNQQQNNQPINSFFSSQTQIRVDNNTQYPQLRNNPMNNIFNNNNNNNRNTMMGNNNNQMLFSNNNFQGNNMNNNNNNFGRQFNQNNNQQGPVMTNFDILEQKLNNLNMKQNKNNFNFNSQSTQFNQGFNNNNSNMNNMNNNNNNNSNNSLMNMLDQLGPAPSQGNANQLVPYIGGFNQNNNDNNNNMNNNFMNNNNNNSQFNNFNNNNNNNNQFNNFNNNNNNNQFNNFSNNNNNNQYNKGNNNFNNNSINFNNNNNNNNQFNNFNNNQNNNFGNNNNRNMFNSQNNNNQMNFDIEGSQNMNNNNFMMGQNNNQQLDLEEIEKQKKLKELDDLF